MQIETDRGADAPANAPPCPETAAEQRAALRQQIVNGPLGEQVREHARAVFKIASGLPPDAAARFIARQIGEALGEERARLRRDLPGNPAVDVIIELLEETWAAAYNEAEREFDRDPKEIAAAMSANATAWRALEASIKEHAARAYDELQAIESAVAVPGVDKRVCSAYSRGLALGKMLGILRNSMSSDASLDLDALEESATAIFNDALDGLARLDAAETMGAA